MKPLSERQHMATTARNALNMLTEGLDLLDKLARLDGQRGQLFMWYSLARFQTYLEGQGTHDVRQWVAHLEEEAKE